MAELKEAIENADVEWRVGTLNGAKPTVFGNPVDVVTWSDRVYVLDAMMNDIRVFNINGQFVEAFGRVGQGPMEFRSPRRIGIYDSTYLAVVTATGLKFYSRQDSGFTYSHMWEVNEQFPSPQDACLLEKSAFLVTPNELLRGGHQLIAASDSAGEVTVWFGKGYESGSDLLRFSISEGLIACDEPSSTVVLAMRYVPVIRAYSPQGRVRWIAHISDFRPTNWREHVIRERLSVGRDRSTSGDIMLSLTALENLAVILQVGHLQPTDKPAVQRIVSTDTYVISTNTGNGVRVMRDVPRVLHADRTRLWAVDYDSLGVLSIVQLRYRYD